MSDTTAEAEDGREREIRRRDREARQFRSNYHGTMTRCFCDADVTFLLARLDGVRRELDALKDAVRSHRDQKGDDRCWLDDYTLYAALGEPIPDHACRQNTPGEMLACCRAYIASRHDPQKPYLSPENRIVELERERDELRAENGRLRREVTR